METIKLQAESYLYENAEGQFREFSFNELSTKEIVIYQGGEPKYIVDFNRLDRPLVQDLIIQINSGEDLETAVWKIGNFIGRGEWTINNKIDGRQISESRKNETIELIILDDLSDFHIDLIFIAVDSVNFDILLNENKLFETYLLEDENGKFDLDLASSFIDNFDNLIKKLTFLFETKIDLIQLASNNEKLIFDLTEYKDCCITTEIFELKYSNWLLISGRRDSMGEYSNLIGIIKYIQRNIDKKKLLLITEKRKHLYSN